MGDAEEMQRKADGGAADETHKPRSVPLSTLFCLKWFEQNNDKFKSRTVCVVLDEITHSSTGKATLVPNVTQRTDVQDAAASAGDNSWSDAGGDRSDALKAMAVNRHQLEELHTQKEADPAAAITVRSGPSCWGPLDVPFSLRSS